MKDLTTGTPAKLIFMFTIPLFVGNVFQQFYNMVDMIIVGQTIGKDALAAVGSTGSITFLIIGFAQGLTAGLSIIMHNDLVLEITKVSKKVLQASLVIKLRRYP